MPVQWPRGFRLLLAIMLPAFVIACGYYLLLGQRFDYLGHYAAGYGATLCGVLLVLAVIPPAHFARAGHWTIAPACLFSIGLGAWTEATVFNLAKFDEIDFCNQSLGAALAGLAVAHATGDQKPADEALWIGFVVGIAWLAAGGYFAFL